MTAISPDALLELIAKEAGLDPAKLTPDATFAELDIGSLDLAGAMFSIEDEFGIEIDPDSVAPTTTIAAFVEQVRTLSAR